MITESSGNSEEKSFSSENGNHNSTTGSSSGNIRQNLQGRLQPKPGNSSSSSGKSDNGSSKSGCSSGSSKKGRESKSSDSKASSNSSGNGDAQKRERINAKDGVGSGSSPVKNFKPSSSEGIESRQQASSQSEDNSNLASSANKPRSSSGVSISGSSASNSTSTTGSSSYNYRVVNNGSSAQSSRNNLLAPVLSTEADDNHSSFLQGANSNSSDSRDKVTTASFASSAAIVFGSDPSTSATATNEEKCESERAQCKSSDDIFSKTTSETSTLNDSACESELVSLSSLGEYEDIVIPVVGKKEPVKGRVWKDQEGVYIRYLCYNDGCEYKPGDSVYIESQRADLPFFICSIQEFKKSKRNEQNLLVNIKWYYRPSEVPETVYQLLIQDRTAVETGEGRGKSESIVYTRELFSSDACDTYPVSILRGKCKVEHYTELPLVRTFKPEPNCFFYVLGYNPETRRLASSAGEIRLGAGHQATLPELQKSIPVNCEKWESLCWKPHLIDSGELLMYLRAARSMAAFAGMCGGGDPDEGCLVAARSETTINALDKLHECGYDPGKALQALVKSPVPKGIDKKWSEDETKRFVKGLRQFGKNFFRIRKELLPHKETGELVEFYYLWKKTPQALPNRAHRRHRRQSVLRRIRAPRNPRNNKEEGQAGDLSSASEDEISEDDSENSHSRDPGYHCRHCFTTSSKDWHHAGKDKTLLCTECRVHFKKYGELPSLVDGNNKDSPYLFRPVAQDDEGRVRTRTRTKELNARTRPKRGSDNSTPEPDMKISGRKSPGNASSASNASTSSEKSKNKSNAASPAPRAKKRGKPTTTTTDDDEKISQSKKRKEDRAPESPSGSSIGSSVDDEAETGDLDGLENDNIASSRTPSPSTEIDNVIPTTTTTTTSSSTTAQEETEEEPTGPLSSQQLLNIPEPNNDNVVEPNKVSCMEIKSEKVDTTNNSTIVDTDNVDGESASESSNNNLQINNNTTETVPDNDEGGNNNDTSAAATVVVKIENSSKCTTESEKSESEDLGGNIKDNVSKLEEPIVNHNNTTNSNHVVIKEEDNKDDIISEKVNNIEGSSSGGGSLPPSRPNHLNLQPAITDPLSLQVPPQGDSPNNAPLITIKDEKSLMSPVSDDLKLPKGFNNEENGVAMPGAPPHMLHMGQYPFPHIPKSSSSSSPYSQPPPLVPPSSSDAIVTSAAASSLEKQGAPAATTAEPSMYSSPLSRFYPHPGMGPHPHAFAPHHHFPPHHHHNAHTLGGILPEHPGAPSSQGPPSQQPPPNTHPGLGDGNATKPEMIPNPLQSLREVKVPGYPAFDTNAPTSVASVTSVSPFPTTTSNHQNAEKVPKKEEFSSSSSAAERRGSIGEISNNERERDSKNKSPKTNSSSSSANSTPSSQPPPISAAMGSTTMTTPAGPQGPIVHPNIHLPPTSGAPPFPGAFHPHPHPIHPLYQFPYAPYFSPYAPYFPGPPPQPGGPPGPIPRMPPIPPQQGVRSSSPQAGQSVNGLVKGNNENSPSNSSSSGQGQSQSQSSSHGHHHHHHGSSSSSKSKHGHSSSSSSHGSRSNPEPVEDPDDAEETPSPHGVPRGPSPEAKVEDSECHRSQSAIFIRRLARGSSDGSYFNSCARTDLTFKPVPESKLARKREERLRKQVEKEREERERAAQARKQLSTPDRDKRETPKPGTTNSGSMGQGMPGQGLPPPGNGDPHFDPRFTPRPPGAFGDTPALRQLSDFARPHTGFSPGRPSGMLPPLPLDQMLGASPYNMSLYGQAAARERMEMEALEKREREIREIRERELSDRLKEEFLRNVPGAPGHPPSTPVSAPGPGGPPRLPNPLESHFMDIHRRYSALGGPGGPPLSQLHQSGFGLYPPSNAPPTSTLSPLERERLERLGIPSSLPQLGNDPLLTERLHAERLMAADMNMRLQLAASAAGAGGSGYPGMDHLAAAYASRQPQLIPPRDSGPLGLHPAEMLGRAGYPPELAHHISAHEQLQRQMMMDRERFNHPGAGGAPPGLAPHFLAQQQEEYLRQQQRDREMKIRTLEEAARRH